MGAISLYRGNLHRSADIPRRWLMPRRAISLSEFRHLLRKRILALSRFSAGNPNLSYSPYLSAEKGYHDKVRETVCPNEVPTLASYSKPSGSSVPSQPKDKVEDVFVMGLNDCEAVVVQREDRSVLAGTDSMEVTGMTVDCRDDGYGKEEVMVKLDTTDGKEARKRDLEKKLDVLNAKKHYLVQMLKQILNAEEEIKRRSVQSATARSFVPPQVEASAQTGAAARNPPKNTDLNFGGDPGCESIAPAASNHINQARQWPPLPATSPSMTSISKSPLSFLPP